jgi:hypothetical protein
MQNFLSSMKEQGFSDVSCEFNLQKQGNPNTPMPKLMTTGKVLWITCPPKQVGRAYECIRNPLSMNDDTTLSLTV